MRQAPSICCLHGRTVWGIWLQDGSVIHCVLWERKRETSMVWYWDDEVQGVEEFLDPVEAEEWANSLRAELLGPDGGVADRCGVE